MSRGLEREPLLWLFSAFLVFAGLMMLLYTPRPRAEAASTRVQLAVGSGVGSVAGFVGGLLGVGGGNIIVPALVALGLEPKKASASTSFVVIFSSLAGFLGHATLGGTDLRLLAWTAAGAMGGAALGAWLMSAKLQGRQSRRSSGSCSWRSRRGRSESWCSRRTRRAIAFRLPRGDRACG